MNTTEPTYEAHFAPEAWQNDYAVPVDPEGPQTWDCTAYAREWPGYLADLIAQRGENLIEGVVDNDDVFKSDPDAPEWVRTWRGPFTIRIRELT